MQQVREQQASKLRTKFFCKHHSEIENAVNTWLASQSTDVDVMGVNVTQHYELVTCLITYTVGNVRGLC